MEVFIAIVGGLVLNWFTGGVPLYSILCVFAGIFLMMPPLLKFQWKDFLLLKRYPMITLLTLLINFGCIPLIFSAVSLLFFDEISMTYAFLLLGLMSGGGMLLSWVQKNAGDTSLAFSLFFLNFSLFALIFFPLNGLIVSEGEAHTDIYASLFQHVGETPTCVLDTLTGGYVSCFTSGGEISPMVAFFVLILFPFFLSRIIRLSKKCMDIFVPHIKHISRIATSAVILYIFSLEQVHYIFSIESLVLGKIAGVLLLSYILIYLLVFVIYIYGGKNELWMSVFWVSVTRFITLGLIFSFVYSTYFGVNFLLVFVLAYFVQIIFSSLVTRYIFSGPLHKEK